HRVRTPPVTDFGERRGALRAARAGVPVRAMGRWFCGGAEARRQWRVRELPGGRGRGADPRRISGEDLGPAPRDQAALRPDQLLQDLPEHPAGDRRAEGAKLRMATRKAVAKKTAAKKTAAKKTSVKKSAPSASGKGASGGASIAAYFAEQPADKRALLEKLRSLVAQGIPDAQA